MSKLVPVKKGELKRKDATTKRSIVSRGKVTMIASIICLAFLIIRLVFLMLIDENNYRQRALNQYTSEYTISAKRGTIYDRNMNVLAENITVETCFISPYHIDQLKNPALLRTICDGLSEILDIPYDEIFAKAQKTNSQYQVIKKNLDTDTADKVRTFILANNLSQCVHLREATMRYYKYGSLASHLIGFTNSDGKGAMGIEAYYDDILTGIDGRVVIGKDGMGNELPYKYESYVDAIDGSNIVLTIDAYIQSVAEKYCKEAYDEYKPNHRVTCLVMDPTTGEMLACAMYPTFDLNDPYKMDERSLELFNSFTGTASEITAYKYKLLNEMWRNTAVSDTYEPGSTFKVLTTAIGLEEGVTTVNDQYVCKTMEVYDYKIHCHSAVGHGTQSMAQALQTSCNPAFVQLNQKIGSKLFMKYFADFGYTGSTGADIGGQGSSIYQETLLPVSLAVYSFGQTFKITPLSHIRGLSTIANGGNLVTPHFVSSVVDENKSLVKSFDYSAVRQVISSKVSETLLNILYDGTLSGSTRNVCVDGYKISAKTGTSQKRDVFYEDGFRPYISSCIAYAPTEAPGVSVLFLVDEPTGEEYYGGTVAAPYVSKVLSEVLPYMGYEKQFETASKYNTIKIGNYRGSYAENVKENLEKRGIDCIILGNGDIVYNQIPKAESMLTEDGLVVLVTDPELVRPKTSKVPDLTDCSINEAMDKLARQELNIKVTGWTSDNHNEFKVKTQSVEPGTMVEAGTMITVEFYYIGGSD